METPLVLVARRRAWARHGGKIGEQGQKQGDAGKQEVHEAG